MFAAHYGAAYLYTRDYFSWNHSDFTLYTASFSFVEILGKRGRLKKNELVSQHLLIGFRNSSPLASSLRLFEILGHFNWHFVVKWQSVVLPIYSFRRIFNDRVSL